MRWFTVFFGVTTPQKRTCHRRRAAWRRRAPRWICCKVSTSSPVLTKLGGKRCCRLLSKQRAQLHRAGGWIHHRVTAEDSAGELGGLAAVIGTEEKVETPCNPVQNLVHAVFGIVNRHDMAEAAVTPYAVAWLACADIAMSTR